VSRQNCVEVEFESIPQCKLTHRVAGDQPTAFWRPDETVDGAFMFVDGCRDVFGAEAV